MNLDFFFNLIQLFGVLLGLIGVFIIFKIQSLDTHINSYRNNIITSIAQYEAIKSRPNNDQRNERYHDQLVSHFFLIYNASPDEELHNKLAEFIKFLKMQTDEPKDQIDKSISHLTGIRDKWKELKNKKTKTISSIKIPICASTVTILFGLALSTYYNFELVSNISSVSLISLLTFIFILLAFSSLIYISKYIFNSISELI